MKKLPSIAIIAFGLAGLVSAGLVSPYVLAARPGRESSAAAARPRNASPLAVFTTVALGGFRGLAIDVLWARICLLQDEGEYVEIAQLSDWITELDPHLPIVWDYHSFNMAYNIGALSSDPGDRWRWVSAGIRMLRDKAIVYNPREAGLYDRICRIYKHKMVDREDPGRQYYRVAWAEEMTALLGGPYPDYRKLETDTGSVLALQNGYKLDPLVMMEVDRTYGPLDWRLPETHVVYWATRGSKEAGVRTVARFGVLICEAMSETFFNGHVVDFRPMAGILTTDTRDDLLQKTIMAFESAALKGGFSLDADDKLGGLYRSFLRQALVCLTDRQQNDQVNMLFSILRDKLHDKGSDRPIDEYIAAIRSSKPDVARQIREP